MKLFKNILLLIAVFCTSTLFAQDGLPGSEVDVVKSFNARLQETEKIQVTPQLPSLDTTSKRQYYNVITKTIQVKYLPPKIKPLAAKRKALQKKYDGYLKLGAGLPTSFYGEASYDYVDKKKKNRFGLDFFHYSANNTRNIENQKFGYTKGDISGTYYSKQGFAVKGLVGYSVDKVHFYGYNDLNTELDSSYTFEASDIEQRFTTVYGNAEIFNGEKLALDFNYSAGVDFYLLQDSYAARERGFALTLAGTKWFNETHPLNVKLVTDFTTTNVGSEKTNLNNFSLQPNFTFHADRFKVKLGVNITSHEDNFRIFPDVEANANIVDGVVTAFIGAEGALQKNSFKRLSDYNPFIESQLPFKNSSYSHYYGGVKGNIAGIEYNAKVGYKKVDDLAMFLLSSPVDSISRFNVLYDTATIVNIKATISAPLVKGLDLTASVSQNVYTLENEEKAWHLPVFTVSAGARYRTDNQKLLVKADFFLENGLAYKNIAGEAETLNALFDISVGAEYFFTKKIGAFVQLNNLAANKRQRWRRYPTMGLNALFGITARF